MLEQPEVVFESAPPKSLGPQPEQVLSLVAEVYKGAALAGLSMRRIVEALESFRVAAAAAGDCFDVLDVMDEQVGFWADDERLTDLLYRMRQSYIESVSSATVSELRDPTVSGEEALGRFRAAWGAALGRRRFWVALAIAQAGRPEFAHDPMLARMPEWIEYLEQRQLASFPELLLYLAKAPGPDRKSRVLLLAMAGALDTYNCDDCGQADRYLSEAVRLDPDNPEVVSAYGDYWLKLNEVEKARQAFSRALELNPQLSSAHGGLGDVMKRENNWQGAEEEYERAMRAQPGYTTGYLGLMSLYARPELFKERIDRLRILTRRLLVIEPDAASTTLVTVGKTFQENGHYDEAHQYYQQIAEVDPGCPDGFIAEARSYEERKMYDQAAESLRHALEIAPNSVIVHFDLGNLHEQREQWDQALASYLRAVELPSPWTDLFAALAADMKWKLERRSDAVEDLLRFLLRKPGQSPVLSKLQEFATRYYEEQKDQGAARSLLDRLLEIQGEEYRGNYENRLGNLYYYSSDYAQAAEHYSRACQAKPTERVYHSNLAVAYKALEEWEAARQKLSDAFDIDHDQGAYDKALADLMKAEGDSYFKRAEYHEALSLYRAAAELQPKSGAYHSDIASALEKLPGGDQKAAELFEAIETLRTAEKLGAGKFGDRIAKLEDRRLSILLGYADFNAEVPVSPPVRVELGQDLVPKVDPERDGGVFLNQLIPEMRSRLEKETGVSFPGIKFRENLDIPANAFSILLNDAPRKLITFEPDPPQPVLVGAIEEVLSQNAGLFLDFERCEDILEHWDRENRFPEPVRQRLNDSGYRLRLCRLLRTLARERVPIYNPEALLGAIQDSNLAVCDMPEAIRSMRMAMKSKLPGNEPGATIIYLPLDLEAGILAGMNETQTGWDPHPQFLHEALTRLLALAPGSSKPCTLVVREPALRAVLSQLLEYQAPELRVLSAEESLAELQEAADGVHHA